MHLQSIFSSSLLIRLLTHNIRYATTDPFEGEDLWPVRRPRIISELRFNTFDNVNAFIGLQEVLHEQLVDVMVGLNNNASDVTDGEWAYIGVGRDDGMEAGEYSPILYRPCAWHLHNYTTKWLSPTPDVPSGPAWDAGSIRIVTIGHFQHVETGAEVVAMNTHLDNAGTISRQQSAEIITNEINARKGNGTHGPVVYLTGDFNSEPQQEAYQYMTRDVSPVYDEKTAIAADQQYGGRNGTYTGFSSETETTQLDYIFLQKTDRWTPKTYAVLANVFDEGIYYSDHRAVVADVELSVQRWHW